MNPKRQMMMRAPRDMKGKLEADKGSTARHAWGAALSFGSIGF
jgi:hypothetical protein